MSCTGKQSETRSPGSAVAVLAAGVVVVSLAAWYFSRPGGEVDSREEMRVLPAPVRETKVSDRPETVAKPREPERVTGNEISLEEIKRRWLALGKLDPSIGMTDEEVAEREALAIETLRALRLSAAAFELDELIRENRIRINRNGSGLFGFLRKILEEDPAMWGEMKDSLLKTLHDTGAKVAGTSIWGGMAAALAEYGTDEDFEGYYQDLKGDQPELATKALLMRGSNEVEKAPERLAEMMGSTLQRLSEDGGFKSMAPHALPGMVSYDSPVEEYEKTLEVVEEFSARNPGVKLSGVKDSVVQKWARKDPVGVTEMVLGDRSLYSEDVMRSAGGAMWLLEKEQGTEAAMQWLASIPDDEAKKSAIRGAALSTAASYLEGGKKPEHVAGYEKALHYSNLLSPAEREEVFGEGSLMCRDRAPAE